MTENNPLNNDLEPCPDEDTLREYASQDIDDEFTRSIIKAHLQFCPECNSKVQRFISGMSAEDFLDAQTDQFISRASAVRKGIQDGARPGSLWRAVPDLFVGDEPPHVPLLVILGKESGTSDRYVRVAEVSEEIDQAIHTDILLSPEESGLSFVCMVRSENTFKTGYDSLEKWVGQLPPMLIRRVLWFCDSPGSLDDKVPLSEYLFLKDSEGTTFMQRRKVTSGLLVVSDDDPRLGVLEKSIKECSYLHFLAFDMVEGMDDLSLESVDDEIDISADLDESDDDDS